MDYEKIDKMSIVDFNEFLDKRLDSLSKEELYQLCNYETMAKIELLDKQIRKPYYLQKVLQEMENRLIDEIHRTNVEIKMVSDNKASAYHFAKDEITMENMNTVNKILYPQYLIHENTHSEETIAIKYQEIKGRKGKQIQSMRDEFRKNYPKSQLKKNCILETPLFDDDTLKQFIISYKTNLYIQANAELFAQEFAKTNDFSVYKQYELCGYYEYMSAIELEARVKEIKYLECIYNNIIKTKDISIIQKQLDILKENIEKHLSNYTKSKTMLNDYLEYVKEVLKQNNQPEYKIFNKKEMERYVNSRLDWIIQNCKSILEIINKDMKKINEKLVMYTHKPEFHNLKEATEYILNDEKDTYEKLRYQQNEIVNAIKIMDTDFNFDFLKYDEFLLLEENQNNFQVLFHKLYELYKDIDNYVYEKETRDTIKTHIESIFIKIFEQEKNIHLVQNNIDTDILHIVETKLLLEENKQLEEKLKDCQMMVDLRDRKINLKDLGKEEIKIDESER